jgi:transcriptional regulator with XRE-family HTH domain
MKKNSLTKDTFGSFIRELRIKNNLGQRGLAKEIGIAPSYLNDIEKNKRAAPRNEIIKKISIKLKTDLNFLYDLAGDQTQFVNEMGCQEKENN